VLFTINEVGLLRSKKQKHPANGVKALKY